MPTLTRFPILVFFLLVWGLSPNDLFAQTYIRIGLGYGFSAGSAAVAQNTVSNGSTGTTTYQDIDGSFGKGTSFDATIGDALSPQIALELEFSYLTGEQYNSTHVYTNAGVPTYDVTDDTHGSLYALTPMIVLSTGAEGFAPYARLGAVIGLPGISVIQSSGNTAEGAVTSTGDGEYSGGSSAGYRAGIGVKFTAEDRMSWYGELFYTGLSWRWTGYTFTDGAGEASYYHYKPGNSPNNGYALTETQAPFGNIGMQIGIRYEL